MAFDYLARFSYERLVLQQPEVGFSGLWQLGDTYFAVCPSLAKDTKARDGTPLIRWFNDSCRAATAPIQLVKDVPDGALPSTMRSLDDVIEMRGGYRTARDALVDLHFSLPIDFPNFTLTCPARRTEVTVPQPLTPDEESSLRAAYARMGLPMPLDIMVAPGAKPDEAPFRFAHGQGDIDIVPARRLPRSIGRQLRNLVEDDDDFWSTERRRVLGTSEIADARSILPPKLLSTGLSCLVNASAFPTKNLRSYLTLYDAVYLVAPIGEYLSEQLAALGVSETELERLLELGRLRLVLPQSIDRYDTRWLASIAEVAPEAVLLSRRLAAATIVETRRRWPFLYPPIGIDERRVALHILAELASTAPRADMKSVLVAAVESLSLSWSSAEAQIHHRGAMGTAVCGVPNLAANIHKGLRGQDATLEFWSAGANVEWAAALAAAVCPTEVDGYSEQVATESVASLFSLSRPDRVGVMTPEVFTALDNILAVDNDVPIVAFATEFSSADLVRLRKLVLGMAAWNLEPEFLKDALEKFNAEVRRYERRPDRLRTMNIAGFAGTLATTAVLAANRELGATFAPFISLGPAFASALFLMAREELANRSATLSSAIDYANGLLSAVSPDAVLVSRLRKEVKILRP